MSLTSPQISMGQVGAVEEQWVPSLLGLQA